MSTETRSERNPIDKQGRVSRITTSVFHRLPVSPKVVDVISRKLERRNRLDDTLRALSSILSEVPLYNEFKTGAELQAQGRKLAEDFQGHIETGFLTVHEAFGTSSEGRDIDLIEIGSKDAKRTVMWVGTPHPNEAVGTLAIDFMSRYLCEHPEVAEKMDTRFVFIPNSDPDGLALNLSWLKGEMDPVKYALGYYRPPFEEQADWAFPIDYKTVHFDTPPAEAQTIMRAFSQYKPNFYYSLHNSALHNAFFLLSENIPNLLSPIQKLIVDHDLTIIDERSEVSKYEKYAQGVYQIPTLKIIHDTREQIGKVSITEVWGGAKASEYLRDTIVPEAMSLESEMPYFTADALKDNKPSGITKREAVLIGRKKKQEIYTFMEEQFNHVKEKLPEDRLKRAVEKRIELMKRYIANESEEVNKSEYNEEATNAYVFSEVQTGTYMELIQLGQVYRLALQAGEMRKAEEIKTYIEKEIAAINNVSEIKPVSLQKLISLQVAAGLLTQQCLALVS